MSCELQRHEYLSLLLPHRVPSRHPQTHTHTPRLAPHRRQSDSATPRGTTDHPSTTYSSTSSSISSSSLTSSQLSLSSSTASSHPLAAAGGGGGVGCWVDGVGSWVDAGAGVAGGGGGGGGVVGCWSAAPSCCHVNWQSASPRWALKPLTTPGTPHLATSSRTARCTTSRRPTRPAVCTA